MATATFPRKRVMDAATDTIVYITTLRQKKWEEAYARALKPRYWGLGMYRISSKETAREHADWVAPSYLYEDQLDRIRAIGNLATETKSDVTLTADDVKALML